MTKAGNKGGNLRDKLDGNELDLSLSDLNEVPVKELVSIAPRGPGAHRRPAPALAWAASFLIPASVSRPYNKVRSVGLRPLGGRARPPWSSWDVHVSFGRSSRRWEELLVRPWDFFYGSRVTLPTLYLEGLQSAPLRA